MYVFEWTKYCFNMNLYISTYTILQLYIYNVGIFHLILQNTPNMYMQTKQNDVYIMYTHTMNSMNYRCMTH